MKQKVIIGLSGGVDSSVAAYLLIEQGYEVEALFMRNWDAIINDDVLGNKHLNNFRCPQEEDYEYAELVAKQLKIKIHRVDFIQEYWQDVFSYFIDEHKKGRTPNPDILCNKYIKFKRFRDYAFTQLNADYIAMGHYAKLTAKDGKIHLIIPLDKNKDQTYFLANLKATQLTNCLFPLANLTKQEVRTIAKQNQLVTAEKKDSTGICFIGERRFSEFLKNYLPSQPGDIIDIKTNQKIGKHSGVMYYTIGQRKGLDVSSSDLPYFVVKKDIDKKILFVHKGKDNQYLASNSCILEDVSFINDDKFENYLSVNIRFRYRQKLIPAKIKLLENNQAEVIYSLAYSVTPGQFCVFYQNDSCLGCGVIQKAIFKS